MIVAVLVWLVSVIILLYGIIICCEKKVQKSLFKVLGYLGITIRKTSIYVGHNVIKRFA